MPLKDSLNKTTWWQKLIAFVGVIAGLGGGISGYKEIKSYAKETFEEEVHNSVMEKVKEFHASYDRLKSAHIKDSIRLEDFRNEVTSTLAVGLRIDSEKKLWYRAFNGNLYRAYKDIEQSEVFGFDSYYYINENDRKIWCY